jgi:hypothetical protein
MKPLAGFWRLVEDLHSLQFICGYCGTDVASDKGFRIAAQGSGTVGQIRICHR